ncbi:hypothetical protein RCZ04_09100 [Capnocytophaga sp. HP1101]
MKKYVRYTLLVITIIAAVPVFMRLFTDYEINKWVIASSYIVIFGNLITTKILFEKEKKER